jgi:hypothetical protein
VLLASHDLNVAASFSDRLILLDGDGTIAAAGAPARVLDPTLLERVYGVAMDRIDRGPGRRPPCCRARVTKGTWPDLACRVKRSGSRRSSESPRRRAPLARPVQARAAFRTARRAAGAPVPYGAVMRCRTRVDRRAQAP